MAMKVMRGCRLQLYDVLTVSAVLYIIPLSCSSTRGKKWSCDRGLFYEGGYTYLNYEVSFRAGSIPRLYLR